MYIYYGETVPWLLISMTTTKSSTTMLVAVWEIVSRSYKINDLSFGLILK